MQAVRIVATSSRVVRWPLEPRGAARNVWRERTALIVGIRSDQGATGLGEAAPLPGMSNDTIDDVRHACGELAARLPLAIASPADASDIAQRISASPAAQFAVETALIVALAQSRHTSVAALLVPHPLETLRVAPVVDDIADAHHAVALGYTCLKMKASSPERVIELSRAVPGVRLRVDANRSWPRADSLTWLARLAGLPIDYVEEPCLDAHDLLREQPACRIALDESVASLSRADLERALRSPSLAALVLKPTLLGGIARCLELAALAQCHSVAPVASHTLEGPIGTFACVELARAIGADVPVGLAPHPALDRFHEANDVGDVA